MAVVYKRNKLLYYLRGFTQKYFHTPSLEKKINYLYNNLSKEDALDVELRVDYYNKINSGFQVQHLGTKISDLKVTPKKLKVYYFDLYAYAKFFDENLLIDYEFGDVNTLLPIPMITKSRPIFGNNENNILLKLNYVRHYVKVNDDIPFADKKNLLIGRSAVYQEHRQKFYSDYFNNPLCDLGQVNKNGGNLEWLKPKISIEKHLKNKFILSLEGNDVATNLKWIMSSNSIAVSPPLKMETWYMEGTLVPNQHFIQLKEDSSDLEEKLQYYIDHPKEAEEIIAEAQKFRSQFENPNKEDLISLLVLQKYFEMCGE